MRSVFGVFLCLGMCCAGNSWAAGFSNAAPIGTARYLHTATLLSNGRVLIAGGTTDNSVNFLTSAELYDPASNTWSPAGNLGAARGYHTATLLPNGKVLVVGGYDGNTDLGSAELYDPANNMWIAAANLTGARGGHTATLLPNGKVLVVGGHDPVVLNTAEVYDPALNVWGAAASLTTARMFHTATLLSSGKVLVAGGTPDGTGSLASAEVYNPAGNTWSATTNTLATARYNHAAMLLSSGNVLVIGGDNGGPTSSCELYSPGSNSWGTATGLPNGSIESFTATLLPDGTVFTNGGYDGSFAQNTASLYNPVGNTWSSPGSMASTRQYHTSTVLPSGSVLIVGGEDDTYTAINGVEIYDPTSGGSWSAGGSLSAARGFHTATLLPNGKVLVAGGDNGSVSLNSAELYDPASDSWSAAASLIGARESHTATLLQSGKVLVTGGANGSVNLSSAELYDPASNTWSAAASLNAARVVHTATLLPNGKVLVAAGLGNSGDLNSAEVYDPASNTWSAAGSLGTARESHTATLLPSGKVLVAAGYNSGNLSSAELYDPTNNTWSAAGSLSAARYLHTATLLPSGKVLAAAGYNGASLSSAEVYDPASDTWGPTGSLGTTRNYHTATLLPNGKVLVAAGDSNNIFQSSAELYDAGLGFQPAWRPNISFTKSPLTIGFDALILGGGGFTGISEASGGSSNNSATNYPIVQLRSLGNDQTVFLPSTSVNPSPNTGFVSTPIPQFPQGWAMVTIFTNGIPSISTFTQIQSLSLSPVITFFDSQQNPAFIGTPVTFLLTATDPDTANLTYTIDFGDMSAPSTGTMLSGSTVTAVNAFTAAGNFNVTATVSDGQSIVPASITQVIPAPDSGGEGVPNVSSGLPPVVNPLNGISIAVISSNGGGVQLGVNINALIHDVFKASTDFGDIAGHAATVEGTSPVHQFVQHGIFVAKSSAINTTTGTTAGIARKTITIGSKETGEAANAVGADRLGNPPSNDISVKSIKSKFTFKGATGSSERATSTDTVTFSGSILLPSGLNPAKPHEFSVGIGNIIVNAMLDAHGKGTSTGGSNLLKSMKVTFKGVKKGAVTKGGETAQFALTFSTTGIVAAGFDTEGISNKSTDVTPGHSAMRKIQLALLLDGTPYEFQAGVTFALSKDSVFGNISGRSAR